MGERANEIAGSDPPGANPQDISADERTGTPSVSPTGEDEEIAAARTEIERTRSEMSETIDAIEERLSPEHLKEEAKETVKQVTIGKARQALDRARHGAAARAKAAGSTARGVGLAAAQYVRERPLPVAAAIVSLVGLTIGVRVLQGRRQRAEPLSRVKSATRSRWPK